MNKSLDSLHFENCTVNIANIVINHVPIPRYRLRGGAFMYVVKDNTPETPYAVDFQVVDAEGSPVPNAAVLTEVTSDNPSAVAVNPDPADPKKGTVTFGSPNPDGSPSLANITCQVKLPDGTLVGSFGAQFTVTAGDPAAIAGGSLQFQGLTES